MYAIFLTAKKTLAMGGLPLDIGLRQTASAVITDMAIQGRNPSKEFFTVMVQIRYGADVIKAALLTTKPGGGGKLQDAVIKGHNSIR